MNDENTYSSWAIAAFIMCFIFTIPAFILSAIAIKENYNEKSKQLALGVRIASIARIVSITILVLIWGLIISIGESRIEAQKHVSKRFEDAYEVIDETMPLGSTPTNINIEEILGGK